MSWISGSSLMAMTADHASVGLRALFKGQIAWQDGVLGLGAWGEDGLRQAPLQILDILRLAAVDGLGIAAPLATALHRQCSRLALADTSGLRFGLWALLAGDQVKTVLLEFGDVLAAFIPEIHTALGFDQRSPWHDHDVWKHTVLAISAAPADEPLVRLALLFHDLGKPASFEIDQNGHGHFYGHARLGATIARRRLAALGFANSQIEAVCELVLLHLEPLRPDQANRWLLRLGEPQLLRLLALKRGDALAHTTAVAAIRLAQLDDFTHALDALL